MKIWELEEGKEYETKLKLAKFKVVNNVLFFYDSVHKTWRESNKSYNDIVKCDFIEYTPPIDWSKIEVDTKVLVRDWDDSEWIPRYFAKFEDCRVYVWNNGRNSFTSRDEKDYIYYGQVKLYESFKATKSIVEEMQEYIGAGGETMDKKLRQWISQLNGAFL